MEVDKKEITCHGFRFSISKDGEEIARARLYILSNNLHIEPFGFLEDVFVHEKFRKNGLGKQIWQEITKVAQRHGCYKIVGTCRYTNVDAHDFYRHIGMDQVGDEFRLNLKQKNKKIGG